MISDAAVIGVDRFLEIVTPAMSSNFQSILDTRRSFAPSCPDGKGHPKTPALPAPGIYLPWVPISVEWPQPSADFQAVAAPPSHSKPVPTTSLVNCADFTIAKRSPYHTLVLRSLLAALDGLKSHYTHSNTHNYTLLAPGFRCAV